MIERLINAKRPLILLGGGARYAAQDIIKFAECWNIPMMTTWNAVDLVPYAHPLFVGRPGIIATRGSNQAIHACDFLLSIGARLDQPTIAYDYQNFAPDAYKVMVDIDISERLKIPNLDEFILQDAGKFISGILECQLQQTPNEWLRQCAVYKLNRMEGNTPSYQLLDKFSEELPNDAIIVCGASCTAIALFCAGFRNKAGQRFIISSCGLGSMGATLPVAIGAAIASGKPVTMIDGDGSFMQNIQELELIKRYNLPITIYIINNGGYGAIRSSEMRAFGRSLAGETIPNVTQVARAFGVNIIEVVTKDEVLAPRVMFDGRGSLSDMWPYK
jgi:acetolactate synthase I/II/III large subunit